LLIGCGVVGDGVLRVVWLLYVFVWRGRGLGLAGVWVRVWLLDGSVGLIFWAGCFALVFVNLLVWLSSGGFVCVVMA